MDRLNPIRDLSDIRVLVPRTERLCHQGAATSLLTQLAVVDVLFSELVSRNLDISMGAYERTMQATHKGVARSG